jgi:hypothetical protein
MDVDNHRDNPTLLALDAKGEPSFQLMFANLYQKASCHVSVEGREPDHEAPQA